MNSPLVKPFEDWSDVDKAAKEYVREEWAKTFGRLQGSQNSGLQAKAPSESLLKKAMEIVEEDGKKSSHPRVQADSKVNLNNFINFQYSGPLWMGSADQQVKLIYDTGSDWLLVETDFCPSCIAPVFDTGSSTTYARVSDDKIYQYYGSGSMSGYRAKDTVAVNL